MGFVAKQTVGGKRGGVDQYVYPRRGHHGKRLVAAAGRTGRRGRRLRGFFFCRGKPSYKDQRQHRQTEATTGGFLLSKGLKTSEDKGGRHPGCAGDNRDAEAEVDAH